MADTAASLQVQQLLELLAVVSSFPDEASAVHGAVERAAQALEAEVAAVVYDDRVAAAVGFPEGAVPAEDLLAVARLERDWLDVPGLDRCQAVAANWAGSHPGHLLLARWGDEPFSVEERNLVRGMARLLELTLTMLRTLQAEHAMRERSEQHAAENARLLESLRQRQRVLENLFVIQRSISRREPLREILDMVTTAAWDLLGGERVTLWLRDQEDPDWVRMKSTAGLAPSRRLPPVRLAEAGVVGAAIRTDELSTGDGVMAAPVHESGAVIGGLVVTAARPLTEADEQVLRAFAENASMALTDSQTVIRLNQAFHDALTGLASRGLFLERLAQQLVHSGQVALLFVDLDRFKSINDTLGHGAGDQLLMATAERIKSQLRSTDLAARFGGDEFAIMLCGLKALDEAVVVAERIVRALGDPMVIADQRLIVNASIGIAFSELGGTDVAELMRRADVAMYQAKRNGRARYEVFDADWTFSTI
jgi:diguanylate cyclase (GGDEF)-like protein